MSPIVVNRDKIAVLHGGRRVWAVGAVHGEADRLRRLHRMIADRFEPGDRLVYLGNFLGHGDGVRESVDEILRFRSAVISAHGMFAADVSVLRGAQEEMWHKLLQLQLALNPADVLAWMLDQGVGATIAAYGGSVAEGQVATRAGAAACARWTSDLRDRVNASAGHTQIMSALRRAAVNIGEDSQSRMLFVNAGIDPARPLETQKDSFWWPPGDMDDFSEPYESFARIVCGYDRQNRGVRETPFMVSLDGGAGRGGALAAGCFTAGGELIETLEV
ncbi:MAG: hypothetical protein ABJ215_08045 [Alphaproteobacteria bacterium]